MTIQLRPYQQQLIADVRDQWQHGARNVLMHLATGGGKCLGKGTPILMFDGTIKPVEEVQVGDALMGPDSGPRQVRSVCTGVEPLYRVVPTKGEPYVVNESHILSLQKVNQGARRMNGGDIVNVPVTDYLAWGKTQKHIHKGWRTGVSFPEKNLHEDLPPYLLGVWLGDGSSRATRFTTMDPEILFELMEYAAARDMSVTPQSSKSTGRAHTFAIVNGGEGYKNRLARALRYHGLMPKKFIPHDYKTGSDEQRLEVLAGLLDTDGSYTGKGFDFISKLKGLAEDVVFLARSLGMAAYLTECRKGCPGMDAPKVYYRVHISGDVDRIPCRLPRKQARTRLQKKSVMRTGIRLEPLGPGQYFGFEIDGDRLFLLGDFTVTHNTACLGSIVEAHQGASCVIAHRSELVSQVSQSLAQYGVMHDVICSDATRRIIAAVHVQRFGKCYLRPGALCRVASVDTLVRRDGLQSWAATVTLWIVDEGHHLVLDNKWHKAVDAFTHPHAHGLLPTATPVRADGKGLGRHADGLADVMVAGPSPRWLIEEGWLSDYDVVCPTSDLEMLSDVAASGDWSQKALKEAAKRSHIVGDVVGSYLSNAPDRLGVTFATDVETATAMATAYREAGIPAEVLTGKTDDRLRASILQRFERREVLQLCVVDIVSEGFDLPSIEVLSMGRPTQSLGLYSQQFGRGLRPVFAPGHDLSTRRGRLDAQEASGKGRRMLLIDHVGNFIRHQGGPDAPRAWTLDRREKRSSAASDVQALRVCTGCLKPFKRMLTACPHCGEEIPPPAGRAGPEQVDGDLALLSPEVLAALRAELPEDEASYRERLMASRLPEIPLRANMKRHGERLSALAMLRHEIAVWSGALHAAGMSDREIHKAWWLAWGGTVYDALSLSRADAIALTARVKEANDATSVA